MLLCYAEEMRQIMIASIKVDFKISGIPNSQIECIYELN